METLNLFFPWFLLQERVALAARVAFRREKYMMRFVELWKEDERHLNGAIAE